MAKGGRPSIDGLVRYGGGRINYRASQREPSKRQDNKPNPRVEAERALFNAACFQGGGHGAQCFDPLGQLFLVGKLDKVIGYKASGEPIDLPAKKLLEEGRGYWNAREYFFREVAPKSVSLERASRSSGTSVKATKLEREYLRYQRLLRRVSIYDIESLHEVMEVRDGSFSLIVARIVQTELLRKSFRLPLPELASDRDEQIVASARRALVGLCGFDPDPLRLAA